MTNNSELSRRIDEVLYYVWDPIGVSDEPCARGEYDDYIPDVFRMLMNSVDVEVIAEHLAKLTKEAMGLTPDFEKCRYAADILIRHKKAISERLC